LFSKISRQRKKKEKNFQKGLKAKKGKKWERKIGEKTLDEKVKVHDQIVQERKKI